MSQSKAAGVEPGDFEFRIISLAEFASLVALTPEGAPMPEVRAVRTDEDDAWLAVSGAVILGVRRTRTWRRFKTLDAIYSSIQNRTGGLTGRQIRLFVDIVPLSPGTKPARESEDGTVRAKAAKRAAGRGRVVKKAVAGKPAKPPAKARRE